MEIPKDQILQMLRNRGDYCKAELAEQQLPTRVDPDRHAVQLGRIGIGPQEILTENAGKERG
jgi:hypothetical protein